MRTMQAGPPLAFTEFLILNSSDLEEFDSFIHSMIADAMGSFARRKAVTSDEVAVAEQEHQHHATLLGTVPLCISGIRRLLYYYYVLDA